jgi:hypothetical protein
MTRLTKVMLVLATIVVGMGIYHYSIHGLVKLHELMFMEVIGLCLCWFCLKCIEAFWE